MSKFYTFRQNNSGGAFDYDENLANEVVIEANNAREANSLAKGLGIYFNGCDVGTDCECCGDRWYPVDAIDGEDELKPNDPQWVWFHDKDGTYRIVHYKDGRKERVKKELPEKSDE